jgi:hypothetical protein
MRRAKGLMAGLLVLALHAGHLHKASAQGTGDHVCVLVELAWLADPELCCYHPSARRDGDMIIIGGLLPSEALRERALQISSRVSGAPVIDEIKIHPSLRFSHVSVPSETLIKNAAQTLKSRFPAHYKQWQLGIGAPGEVIVAGAAGSLETKLLVSQKLRVLPGCRCVNNQLRVPIPTGPVAGPAKSVTTAKTPNHAPAKLPVGPAPATVPVPPSGSTLTLPESVEPPLRSNPVGVALGPKVQPVQDSPALSPAPKFGGKQPIPGSVAASTPLLQMPGGAAVWVGSSGPVATSSPATVAPHSSNVVVAQPLAKGHASASPYVSPQGIAPGHVAGYPSTSGSVPMTWEANSSNEPPLEPSLLPRPAGPPVPANVKHPMQPGNSYPLMPPMPPAHKTTAKQFPAPAVVPVEDSPELARIRVAIVQATGTAANRLELKSIGGKLQVRFTAPSDAEADRVAKLILSLPALNTYRLELKIDVPQK